MKYLKYVKVFLLMLVSVNLRADIQIDEWESFVEAVAQCNGESTNRVFYAGLSNGVFVLYHECSHGIKEWMMKNVNVSDKIYQQYCSDKKSWLIIKDNQDEKFSHWNIEKSAWEFVNRMPSNSALVRPLVEYFTPSLTGSYKDGTPMLVCVREYRIISTMSKDLRENDLLSIGQLVDGYVATTNILSSGKLLQRSALRDDRAFYAAWESGSLMRKTPSRFFTINDEFATPLALVWNSDPRHETVVPFDEKLVIDAYKKKAETRSLRTFDSEVLQKPSRQTNVMYEKQGLSATAPSDTAMFQDFIYSVVSVPCDQTNIVYYAGTSSNGCVLVHQTSEKRRMWNFPNINIDKSIFRDFSEDSQNWITLKNNDEDTLRYWDWHKEIDDFVQKQTKKSALVMHCSTIYRVDGDLSDDTACVRIIDVFSVESTSCEVLKKGDKICTEQLYDGSKESKQWIIAEARSNKNPIVARQFQSRGLCLARWEEGRFISPEELPSERLFIINNEIVAPFEAIWNLTYDGLIHFDEGEAVQAYKRRAH